MVSKVGKDLLKNMILHTDSHNKRVEISDMWQQKAAISRSSAFGDQNLPGNTTGRKRREPYDDGHHDNGRLSPVSYERKSKRAHMDDEPSDTFWMRQLQKFEEKDPDRWGHGGYKEMYPREFDSDRSDAEQQQNGSRHNKRKKNKVKKKRKKSSKSDTDSDSSLEQLKSHKTKKKHKKRHAKSSISSSTDSDSETDTLCRKKKRRKRKHSTSSQDSESQDEKASKRKSRTCAKKSKHKHKKKKKHK